jgi:hypothetical protein
MRTTAGQILINDALPHDLRDYSRVLDKAGIQDLMKRVATQYPDRYRTIVKDLSDVGRHIAYVTNGNSVGLDDLRPSPRAEDLKKELRAHVNQIMQDPGLSPASELLSSRRPGRDSNRLSMRCSRIHRQKTTRSRGSSSVPDAATSTP